MSACGVIFWMVCPLNAASKKLSRKGLHNSALRIPHFGRQKTKRVFGILFKIIPIEGLTINSQSRAGPSGPA